jgi:hypothetical protein
MSDAGGGAESSTITRVRGWKKFRELLLLLTTKAASLKVRGKLYATCVILHGSETLPVKVNDSLRLYRNEMSMIRWMCGVLLKDRFSSESWDGFGT